MGATTFFFLIVAAGKLLWIVLRKSILDPSFKVLYQPLPVTDRLVFQSRVSAVGQVSTLLVGLVLVAFDKESLQASYLYLLALPLLVVWIFVARRLYQKYRDYLVDTLQQTSGDKQATSPVEIVKREIHTGAPEDLGYFFKILERLDPALVSSLLIEKLDHVLPQVRLSVLDRLRRAGAVDARQAVEDLAARESAHHVREAANRARDRLREIADLAGDTARLVELLRVGTVTHRGQVALALGWSQDAKAYELLAGLLVDRDPGVRRTALLSAGRVAHPRLWPQIVSLLATPRYADTASSALVMIGEKVLPELELAFRKLDQDPEVLRRILVIYESIGGARTAALLQEKIKHPNKEVRGTALRALNGMRREAGVSQPAGLEPEIEKVIRTMVWNTAALYDLGHVARTLAVQEALEGEIAQNRATLFLLLALVYDASTIDLVQENIESERSESIVYALEILEILISPALKAMVLPVLEELSPPQRLKRLESSFPWQHMGVEERLQAVLFRDYSLIGDWTKACAISAIGELHGEEKGARQESAVPDVLIANLFHPDPMLQEIAAQQIFRLDPEEYARHLSKLPFDERERLDRVIQGVASAGPGAGRGRQAGDNLSSLFDRVVLLTGARGFSSLPWNVLIQLARGAEDIVLEPGQQVPNESDEEGTFYIVVNGMLSDLSTHISVSSSRAVIAARALSACQEAIEESHLLRIESTVLLNVMAEYPELVTTLLRTGSSQSILDFRNISEQHSMSTLQEL